MGMGMGTGRRGSQAIIRTAFVGAAFALIVACGLVTGLDGYELIDDAGADASITNNNTSSSGSATIDGDGKEAALPCDPTTSCSPPTPPAGFTRVVFVEGPGDCPAGHDSLVAIEAPTANPSACTCGACTASVNCSVGNMPTTLDQGSGACEQTGVTLQGLDGGCFNQAVTVYNHAHIVPPPSIIGACSAPGIGVRANVTTPPRRLCVFAQGACAAQACPNLAPPQQSCVMTDDASASCPSTFPTKHIVGADFSVACGSCSCTATATCKGQEELFDQLDCVGDASIVIDAGACNVTTPRQVKSRRWVGAVGGRGCDVQAPEPSVTLVQQKTICCP